MAIILDGGPNCDGAKKKSLSDPINFTQWPVLTHVYVSTAIAYANHYNVVESAAFVWCTRTETPTRHFTKITC
jgi:hypothetical protein